MLGSKIFEVFLGIVFLYLLLSLICSALNEFIARILSTRAKYLEAGIRTLLDDPAGKGLAEKFYAHPLIRGLAPSGKKPSYIPSRIFALVMMDIVVPEEKKSTGFTISEFKETVAKIPYASVKRSLEIFLDSAQDKISEFRKSVEDWFDNTMQRTSGWYKRKTQLIILLLSLILTVLFNADTFMMARSLWRDDAVRDTVAAAAEETVRRELEESELQPVERIKQIQHELSQLPLPLGWSLVGSDSRGIPRGAVAWLAKILGLLFTVVAVSLGAPFWFDILNKVVNLRSSGIKPAPSVP
ncbi:MAG: hypothetical protein ACE5LC_10995 [Candidatus Aminicenantales bacterium]